ncbi:MAG: hypothetical protein KDB25_04635 [Leucobacter sp.]|nr:hypothetical protein [Leucobacter sp.]
MTIARWFTAFGALALTCASLGLAGCGLVAGPVDAGRIGRAESEAMPLEQQFDLMRQRYERMQELLADTQVAVAPAEREWIWISPGLFPDAGTFAPRALGGATAKNSYYLELVRATHEPGASGRAVDLKPGERFFAANEWPYASSGAGSSAAVARATTPDDYLVEYEVQPNGQVNVAVYGGPFWGDTDGLFRAAYGRMPDSSLSPGSSRPGEYAPYPKWDDAYVDPGF